jgi:hypothetical protein
MDVQKQIGQVQIALGFLEAKWNSAEKLKFNVVNQEYTSRAMMVHGQFVKDRLWAALMDEMMSEPLPLYASSFVEELKARMVKAMHAASITASQIEGRITKN